MQPVDANWPGFQPLGCGSICTQGFALGWYRSAPLALEAIRRVWIFGERHNFGLPKGLNAGILPHSTKLRVRMTT